ncbi:MAG: alpha/beta fold hydrolase [Armatimonadota bacterium]|nr:alpha/beta fold hydrolase [Armatimonadota bacterium]
MSDAPIYRDHHHLLHVIHEGGDRQPVTSVDEWLVRREHILANMQRVMGQHPGEERRVPLDVEVLEEETGDDWVRRKITYASEPGDRVPAYLLVPDDLEGPAAAMLCLHPTTTIGKAEPAGMGPRVSRQYARELAERGFVTLAPDYPGYGEYDIDPYAMGYASATMKGIWNHQRAIDVLQSLPEVDPERIGAVGHSLGGHNALFVAVFDERVRAVVTSCGFNSFFKYMEGDLSGWSHKGYMPRIINEYDADPSKMPFDFTEVLGAIVPRHVFINAPTGDANFELSGVIDCIEAATPVYELYDAADRLVAVHPECGHDFPPEVREQAWEFLERALR